MINDEVDTDPEDPDSVFVPADRRKFDHRVQRDVIEHDRQLADFERRVQDRIRTKLNKEEKTWYGLREVHVCECTCSYCGAHAYDKGMKLGLNIPKQWWAFNAWWVWRRPDLNNWSKVYLRFTPLSFIRTPQLWWRKNVTRTL